MPKPIAGTAYIKIDGEQYDLRGNMNVSPGSVEREGITGLDRVHGYKEMPRIPFIEADITDRGGLSLEAINAMNDATILVELVNGKLYTFRNAWTAQPAEIDPESATIKLRFEAMSAEEIVAAS